MAVANRSSLAFIVLSALCAMGGTVAEGEARHFLRKAATALASPLGLAVLAFLGWALISIGWSEFKGVSLHALGEFTLPLVAALVLALSLIPRLTGASFHFLAGAFVAASLLMALDLATDFAIRQALEGQQVYDFVFNRSMLTLLVLSAPLLVWFLTQGRRGWALGLFLLLLVVLLVSASGAAVFGLMVGILVFLAARVATRTAMGAVAVVFVVGMLAAPLIGALGSSLIPVSLHETLAGSHTRERVRLWTSFGSAAQAQPYLGGGFGVSPRIGETQVAREVPRKQRRMLKIGHPHNAALQIWVELGVVGVILGTGVLLLTLRAIGRMPQSILRSGALALLAGSAAVLYVGHGAWQGWWAASLGAATIWMLAVNRTQPEIRG